MNKPKLIIIRGLPGSGKSTLANLFCINNKDMIHLEADQYFLTPDGEYQYDFNLIGRAHNWCQSSTAEYLSNGRSVVVSNTFTTGKELRPYFEIALDNKILPDVILMQNDYGNIHNVPPEVLEKMMARFAFDVSGLITDYRLRLENDFANVDVA